MRTDLDKMASAILISFFLTTLFCIVLSLPAQKNKSVRPEIKTDTEEIKTKMVLNNIENSRENPGNSLDSVILFDAEVAPSWEESVKRSRRMKRQVIRGGRNKCPGNMKRFARKCMTHEQYHALLRQEAEN